MTKSGFADTIEALFILERIPLYRDPIKMTPFPGSPFACPKLRKAIKLLDDIPDLGGPPTVDENLLEKWEQFLNNDTTVRLSLKDIRNLCWEPRVAFQPLFRELLEKNEKSLSAAALQGLVFSYHSNYKKNAGDAKLETLLARLITGRGQYMSSLAPWRANLSHILGVEAVSKMAEAITVPGIDFHQSFSDQRLYPNTAFAAEAANRSLLNYVGILSKMSSQEVEHFYESILCSPIIGREFLKKALSNLILHPIHEKNEKLRTRLLAFIMTTGGLRDPRIHVEAWIGIDESAKQRVIQWLSSQEIDFFFGLLIGRADPHGRKAFWMEYVSKIVRSRALLCTRDRETYHQQLRELAQRGTTYAILRAGASSAFFLDFGPLVVVEFSTVGCVYIYDRSVFNEMMSDFWAKESTSNSLKLKARAIETIRHTHDWQQKVRNILSRYGIRR